MKRLLLFILFLSFFHLSQSSEPLKIGVITDVHFLSEKLISDGAAYQNHANSIGKNIKDMHAVLDVVLKDFEKEKIDILLISGDLTNHGERESHLDFVEKLKPLQQNGTRIFVIPGNHDINVPNPKKYIGEAALPTENISAKEFTQLYSAFGYGNALKRDTSSLSYLSKIDEKTWLLCFDTNRYAEYETQSISSGRILPQTLQWALEILREAKEKNITVLGMMHHGLVEHMPYQSTFFAPYLVNDWQKNAEILADAGLKVVFTGHFHSNDVSLLTSQQGNVIYDVETASLSQYPFAYRIMELGNNQLLIDTRFVTSVPLNPRLGEEYREKLEKTTKEVAQSRLKGMGIPFPDETLEALVQLVVRMNILHVSGDEKPDKEMQEAVRNFSELLGNESGEIKTFQLDFPPQDNKLVIELK